MLNFGVSALRHKDLQTDVPLGALARLQGDHACIHGSPLLAEWVGEVVLVFNGHELGGGRSVSLDGLDSAKGLRSSRRSVQPGR